MIGKNGKHGEGDSAAHNQIAKGTRVQGDIKTEGVLRIDGTLIGSVDSTGKLVVGPTGRIEGTVRCHSANISGEVKAKIVVKDMLQLAATAKVYGDMQVGKLSIEPGATYSGACSMGGMVKEFSREAIGELAEKTA